jgi:calcium/calmodulin-dependent protein kinase I
MSSEKHADPAEIPASLTDTYDIGETLGTGHFSKVKLGINKSTKEKVAIKIIKKPTGNKISMLKAEVDIMTKIQHENVVKLFEVHETPQTLFLVMEILTGGELFDRIIAKGHYSEADARKLAITILTAIKHLHENGVAHRDLKPENILLKDTTEDAIIKITDFGLSKIFSDDLAGEVTMKTACGTPGYVAPEVLTHENYSSQVDLWSVGVIVYILLCGFPPFYGDNDAQMFKKIKAGQYKFLAPYWDPISDDAKDFVAKLLVVKPDKRMDATAALAHKWLAGKGGDKNLFGAAEAAVASAEGAADTADDDLAGDMQSRFMDLSLDAKSHGLAKLIRAFDLPADVALLPAESPKSFSCFRELKRGKLSVVKYGGEVAIAFYPPNTPAKKLLIPLKEVKACKQAKKFAANILSKGHSLAITHGADSATVLLEGFSKTSLRDEAWALIKSLKPDIASE